MTEVSERPAHVALHIARNNKLRAVAAKHSEISIIDTGKVLDDVPPRDDNDAFFKKTIRGFIQAPTIAIEGDKPHEVRRLTVHRIMQENPDIAPILEENRLRFNQLYGLYLLLNNPKYITGPLVKPILKQLQEVIDEGYDTFKLEDKIRITQEIAQGLERIYKSGNELENHSAETAHSS